MKTTPIITTIMALALGFGPLLAADARAADKPAAKKATVAPLAAAGTCDSTGLLYPTKPKREVDPNSGPKLDRPLPGEDPHTMAPPPGAEQGMGAPVPEGIDPDKVPGRDGPDREPPPMGTGYWAWYGYHQSEARSDISCRPWLWDSATTAKVGAWGSTPAPGLESDSCADTRWRMVREEDGRKGGDGKETGGTGGGKDSGGSGGNTGGTDNDNTGSADKDNEKAKPDTSDTKPEAKRDDDPEGGDPDEMMSPASAEIAEALAAQAGFDLRGGGSSEEGGESEAEKELERRRRSQPGPGVSPGDGVDPEDGQPDELVNPVGADGKIDWAALGHAASSPAVGNPGDPPKPIGPGPVKGGIDSAAMGHAASSPAVGNPGDPPQPPQPPRPHTDAAPAMATVTAVRGTAQRLSLTNGQATWVPVSAGDKLSRFDIVRTGLGAALDLEVGDAGRISIGSATKLGVGEIGGSEGAVQLNLKYGSVQLAKATNVGAMQVQTPTGTARLTKGRGTVRFTSVRGLKVLGAAQRVATARLSGQGLQKGNTLDGGNAMRPTLSAAAPAAGQAPAVMMKTPRVAGIVR